MLLWFPFPDILGKRGVEVVENEEGNVMGWKMSKNVRRGFKMNLSETGRDKWE